MDIQAILADVLKKKSEDLISKGMSPDSDQFRVELSNSSDKLEGVVRDRMRQAMYQRLKSSGVSGILSKSDFADGAEGAPADDATLTSYDDNVEDYVDININRVLRGQKAFEWEEYQRNDRSGPQVFFEELASRAYNGVESVVGSLAKFSANMSQNLHGGIGAPSMFGLRDYMFGVERSDVSREAEEMARRGVATGAKKAMRFMVGGLDAEPTNNPYLDYLVGEDVDAPQSPSERLGSAGSPSAAYAGQVVGEALCSAPLSIPPMLAPDPVSRAVVSAPFFALGYQGAQDEQWDAYFQGKARAAALGLPAPELPTEKGLLGAGLIGGAFEYGSEYVFDSIQLGILKPAGKWFGKMNQGAGFKFVKRVAPKLDELAESMSRMRGPLAAPKVAAKLGAAAVTEGIEETVPPVGKEVIDLLGITPEEYKSDFFSEETLHGFLVGTTAGGMMSTGAGAVAYAAQTPERRAFRKAVDKALPAVTSELDAAARDDASRTFHKNVTASRGTSMMMHQLSELDAGSRNAVAVNERDIAATVNQDVKDYMRSLGIRRITTKGGIAYYGRRSDAANIATAVKDGNAEYLNGHVNMATGQTMAGALVIRDQNGVIVDVKPYSDPNSRPIAAVSAGAGAQNLTVEDVQADRLHTITDQIQRQVDADLTRSGLEPQGAVAAPKGDTTRGISVLRRSINNMVKGRGSRDARYSPEENYLTPEEVGDATNADVSVKVVLTLVADSQLSEGERKVKTTTGVTPSVLDGKIVYSIAQKDGSVRKIEKNIPTDGAYVGQVNPDGVYLIRENGTAMTARNAMMLMLHELRHRIVARSRAGGQFLAKLLMLDPVFAMRGGAAYMRSVDARNAFKTDAQIVLDYAAMANAAREVLADPSSTPSQKAAARADLREVRTFAEESVTTTANRAVGKTAQMAAEWVGIYKDTQGMSFRKFAAFMASKLVDHGFVGVEAKQALSELRQRLNGANDRQLQIDEAYRTQAERSYAEQMREARRQEAQRQASVAAQQPSGAQGVAPQQQAQPAPQTTPQPAAQPAPQQPAQQTPAQPAAQPFVPANPNQQAPAGVDANGNPVDANGNPFFSRRNLAAGTVAGLGGDAGQDEEDNTPQGMLLRAVNMLQQVVPMLTQTQAQVSGVTTVHPTSSRGIPRPTPAGQTGPTVQQVEVPAEEQPSVDDISIVDYESGNYPPEIAELASRLVEPAEDGARFSIRKVSDYELTEGQRRFFVESRLRDEKGHLIPLYHGTSNEFDTFEPSRAGKFGGGIYLTENPEVAALYASGFHFVQDASDQEIGQRVIPAYVNIKNPFEIEAKGKLDLEYSAKMFEPLVPAMREWIKDPLNQLYVRERAGANTVTARVLLAPRKTKQRVAESIANFLKRDKRQSFLRSIGYDGFIALDKETGKIAELVAFDANQVKGVFNANPTADGRIMYSQRELKRGAENIIRRLNMERGFNRMSAEDAQFGVDFVNRMRDVGDTAMRIIGPMSKGFKAGAGAEGYWDPFESTIVVTPRAIKEGKFRKTFVHELWHAISPYLQDDVVRALERGYLNGLERFKRRYGFDPRDYNDGKVSAAELIKKGEAAGLTIDDWYKYANLDEYLAVVATDATMERLALEEDIVNAKNEVSRVLAFMRLALRNALTSIGKVFGSRTQDAIVRDFMRGAPTLRKMGPLAIEDLASTLEYRMVGISEQDAETEAFDAGAAARGIGMEGDSAGLGFGPMFSRREADLASASQQDQRSVQDEERTGDGAGGSEVRSLAPLEGAPTIRDASGPDVRLVAVAEQYAKDNGFELRRQPRYAEVDEQLGRRIAAAWSAMANAPSDPVVAEAYNNLIEQTTAQYKALTDAGYEFYFFDETNDPYEGNPWNAMRDLRKNQRMAVYATEAGFGSGPTDTKENPLLRDTGLEWGFGSVDGPKKRVLANDLFRAVHDAFGHGIEGAGFRSRGEENAWQAHVRLFTGSAIAALTTETRGQNSWLNFGPYGEANQTASVADTVFADQKVGLMPSWTWEEGRLDSDSPRFSRRKIDLHRKALNTSSLSAFDAKYINYEPSRTKGGKMLGVPEWVKTQDDLDKMREDLYRFVQEGAKGRWWYEKSAKAVLYFVQNDIVKAEKFIQLLAIYSPNSNVWVNTLQAVRAYTHWASGQPQSTFSVGSEVGDAKAISVLYKNEPWEGRKTNSFYLNLMAYIVDAYPNDIGKLNLTQEDIDEMRATMDVWMARAFGYDNEQFGNGKGSDKYSTAENETRRLTARLNANLRSGETPWTPHQVQAAIWSALKSRYEIDAVKKATNAAADAQNLYDNVMKKGVPTKVYSKIPVKRRKHLANWRRFAMAVDTETAEKVVNEMARDFGDDMSRLTQTVTWEAVPSPSFDDPIITAPPAVKAEFTSEVAGLVVDQNTGMDSLAEAIGVPMYLNNKSAGAYSGDVSPNLITRLLPARPMGYDGFNRDEARLYALAIQYAFKQNAVPFMRLENAPQVSAAARKELQFRAVSNGRTVGRFDTQEEAAEFVAARNAQGKPTELRGGPLSSAHVVRFDNPITSEDALEIIKRYNGAVSGGGFTRLNSRELIFVNYRGSGGVPVGQTDKAFAESIDLFTRDIANDYPISEVRSTYVEAEYSEDGTEHDWVRDPSGQSLLQRISESGRPDLLDWVAGRRNEFEKLVSKYDSKYIKARSRQIRDAERARLKKGEPLEEDPYFDTRFSMRRGMRGVKDQAVLAVFDRFDELRRYGEELRSTLPDNELPDNMNPYLGARTLSARSRAAQEAAERRYAALLRDMTQNGISLEEMDDFLTAQHALNGGNAYIASINPRFPDGGTGMTNAEAQSVIDAAVISGRFGQMDRIAGEWRAMLQESLRARLDGGLITQQTYDTLTTRYTHYVPLRGAPARPFDELFEDWDGNDVASRGLATKSRGMPRRFGRRSRALGVTSQVAFVHEDAIRRVDRNDVGNRLLRLVLAVNDAGMAEIVRPTRNGRFDPMWANDKRNFGLYISEPTTINGHKYDRGDLVVIRVNNPILASAVATGTTELRWFERAIRDVNNVWRFMTTGMGNPAFMPVNAIRDVTAGALTNLGNQGVADTVQMLRRWAPAFGRIFMDSWRGRPTGSYAEFIEAGGSQQYWRENDLETKRADFERLYEQALRRDPNDRTLARSLLGWYSAAFEAAENATRLATYEQARSRGETMERAALAARDITVDFAKGGKIKPVANTWYMFLNAGLQGTANVARSASRALAIAPSLMFLGFVNAALARFGGGDDEETGQPMWDNIPSYEKASNFIVMDPSGSGRNVKVPLPYGYNAFYSAGVRIADAMYGMDTVGDAVSKIAVDMLNAFNQMGGSGITGGAGALTSQAFPTMIRPVAEIGLNENFAGRPIYKEQFTRLKAPDSSEFFDGTPAAYTATAQWANEITGGDDFESGSLDISPNTLQYLVGYYLSGSGRIVDKVMQVASGDYTVSDIPIARSFIGDASQDRRAINERYYAMEQALAPTARRAEAVRDVNEDPARRLAAAESIDYTRVGAIDRQKQIDKQLKRIREMMKVASPEQRKNLMGIRTSLMKSFIRSMNELTPED